MDRTYIELNKGNLGDLIKRYEPMMAHVKIKIATSLFVVEPNWEKLRAEGGPRCPICGTRLTRPIGKVVSLCKGKRHGDRQPFIIQNKTLEKILAFKPYERPI